MKNKLIEQAKQANKDKYKEYDNLILEEDRKKGKVESNVYKDYFRNYGVFYLIFLLIVQTLWKGTEVLSNFCKLSFVKFRDNPLGHRRFRRRQIHKFANILFTLIFFRFFSLVQVLFGLARRCFNFPQHSQKNDDKPTLRANLRVF